MIDVVAVGLAGYSDWAPDTGHATYHVDGLYIGQDTTPLCVSRGAALPEARCGGVLWQRIAPN